ncbi:putative tyrosine-protein kinase Wsck [Thrips palmi]|uniref:Tyrosine-protein kinase Wsck n=1 Tax=Thrips palmi TaxID=161013 RepID=A0A6P8YTU5_THRPL|nr:putative tyrosine-protein kinase Wsck [Thrips palmi]
MEKRPFSFICWTTFFSLVLNSAYGQEASSTPLGCYKDSSDRTDFSFLSPKSDAGEYVGACVQECLKNFFRYAALRNGEQCACGSKFGSFGEADEHQCDKPCRRNSSQICGGAFASSVYDTGQKVPGPPVGLMVNDVTETQFHVSWGPPTASNGVIRSYTVTAELTKTFSAMQLPPQMSWTYTSDVRSADVLDLHPGSEYRVSVQAVSDQGESVPAQLFVETHIGYPLQPGQPKILMKLVPDGRIVIQFSEASSDNGPITGYRVIVTCSIAQLNENIMPNYYDAVKKGITYYVAAQLDADAWMRNFTVGDGLRYGGFDNVRLKFGDECRPEDVLIIIGAVSSRGNQTLISYSNSNMDYENVLVIRRTSEPLKEEGLESGLIVAIVVCSVLLVLVVIAYFAARHFAPQRRGASRMEDPQEMSLQGPMIEVENYGYLPEEEENRVDHYDRLKKVLWDIPRNFLDIKDVLLGSGEFGPFMKGTVLQNSYPTPTSVQCIEDGALSSTTKRSMLKELATLINCGTANHANVIRLIGTCETPDMLYVVLEHHPATLKDILLESRTLERPGQGFERDLSSVCSLPQQAFLQIGIGISQGMAHLASNKVIHKQLAACSVLMADGMVPKISNFGIAKCNRPNTIADFTRWTAREIFRSQHFTVKSDVWAMGCLLWEMAALGGTLYQNIPTAEVASRVMRGLRPPHLAHVSDDLYQLMLQCWQLDLDERPDFSEITASLCELINDSETHLDWSVVPGFRYEQYSSELETSLQG